MPQSLRSGPHTGSASAGWLVVEQVRVCDDNTGLCMEVIHIRFNFLRFALNPRILLMKALFMLITRRVCTMKIQLHRGKCFVSDY